jgi:hypothetical protein
MRMMNIAEWKAGDPVVQLEAPSRKTFPLQEGLLRSTSALLGAGLIFVNFSGRGRSLLPSGTPPGPFRWAM